jgi:toxin ParE1/3/4
VTRYQVSQAAEQDLREIFLYWASRVSMEVAERIIKKIADRFWLIGEYPDAGKTCDDLGSGVKCFPAGNYLIYYRRNRRGADIVHVFHGAREQRAAFSEP